MNPVTEELIFTEIVPAEINSPNNAFTYKVFVNENTKFIATVIAQSATGAKNALSQQFGNATFTFLGKSTFIMQVNG